MPDDEMVTLANMKTMVLPGHAPSRESLGSSASPLQPRTLELSSPSPILSKYALCVHEYEACIYACVDILYVYMKYCKVRLRFDA